MARSAAARYSANYYLIGSGRVEIYDDRGVFDPDEGETIRVWKEEDGSTDPSSNALRRRRSINCWPTRRRKRATSSRAAQLTALRNELSDPDQNLSLPSRPQLNVTVLNDGMAHVTGQQFIQIDPAGNVINAAAIVMANMSKFAVRPAASAMTLLDAIFAGLLAVYLLVVGILVLRQSRRGGGMQMAFAILKIPIAILAAIGWMWTIEDANAGGHYRQGNSRLWLWFFLAIGLGVSDHAADRAADEKRSRVLRHPGFVMLRFVEQESYF